MKFNRKEKTAIQSLGRFFPLYLTCAALFGLSVPAFGQESIEIIRNAGSWTEAVDRFTRDEGVELAEDTISVETEELWLHVDLDQGESNILLFPTTVFDRYRVYSAISETLLFDGGIKNPDAINWNPQTTISISRKWGSNFFLRIDTKAGDSVPFSFKTLTELSTDKSPPLINIGMYYGSILCMSVFALLLSFFNKDPDGWKLGITMIAWTLPSMAIWGYGDAPLPFNFGGMLRGMLNQLLVLASTISGWFSLSFLIASAGHSKIHKGLKFCILLECFYLCSTFFVGINWTISVVLILLTTLFGSLTALVGALNKDKAARFLLATSMCSASPFIFLFISPLSQQSAIAVAIASLTLVMLALMQRVGERSHELGRKAQDASERERFLASMSHEIRTPLNGIIGFSELCSKENLQGKVKDYFQQIDRSSKMLLGIVNDVLDYSKLQTADIEVVSSSMSVEETLKDVITISTPLAETNKIELNYEIAADVGEYIVTDPFRCAQILINLCGNAVKFSQEGKVTIKVSRKQQEILFQVIDNGIGIDKNVLAGLFDPFRQADANTARQFGGTGLGLAISKQLCSILGGDLTAVSEKGLGSIFTFKFPYQEGEAPEAPSLTDTTKLIGKKVLIAEDNPVNLKLATHILENIGLCIDSATDGKSALTKATANQYDFILMDMQMPELSGTEATQKIRESGFTHPIIALTANASESDREACLNAGMNDFLAKPIEQQQLLNKLERWSQA